jgi:CRP-like cAMP-binding protein
MATMPQPSNYPSYLREPSLSRPLGTDQSRVVPADVVPADGDHQARLAMSLPTLFSGISPQDYSRITATGRVREFARGEMLYFEGDTIQQVSLITSGLVKTTQVGMSGAEVILRLSGPGDVLGAVSMFSTGKHSRTAEAFRACKVLVWDAPAFKSLVTRYPVLQQSTIQILGEHLRELEERFHEVATEKVGLRVARQLVRLREQIGQPVNGDTGMGISREDLAQMTGTTLFTVSRLLSAWESRGWVKCGRETVTICDVQSLRAISD